MSFISRLFGRKDTEPDGAKADGGLVVSPEVMWTFHNFGHPYGAYGEIYRRQPAVRTVVDFLARNIAQLNPKIYERRDNSDRIEDNDHPLVMRLRNPNPSTSRYRFLRDTVADIAIEDVAYWRKMTVGRTTASNPALVRIPPTRLVSEFDERTGRHSWRHTVTGEMIPREDLVVFPGYSPDGSELGVSPLETLRRVLAEEWAATRHRENFWRNSARQQGVIERPVEAPEWSDEARARFRKDWEDSMSGAANAGRTGILEEGMKWNTASFSPKESEYIQGRRLTYEEVGIAYFGPFIGPKVAEAIASEQTHRQMYQDVLGPVLRFLQDEIELQLLYSDYEQFSTPGSKYIEFNLAEKLKGSFEEQGKTLVTAVGVPYMSINEGRSRLNLPRIEDEAFDEPVKPLNVMYGGQPSVTTPTADPSTPVAASVAPRGRKQSVPASVRRRRDRVASDFEGLLRSHFERVERTVRSSLSGKAVPLERWEDWAEELTDDLYIQMSRVTRRTGSLAAEQIEGTYDHSRVLPFLSERARVSSEKINEGVRLELDGLFDAGELSQREAVDKVFDEAKTSRSNRLGATFATSTIAFARTEAARHSEDEDGRPRTKTWIVTSSDSRHPEMNGETVPVGELFSNGLAYPGDATGGSEATAGCACLMDLG